MVARGSRAALAAQPRRAVLADAGADDHGQPDVLGISQLRSGAHRPRHRLSRASDDARIRQTALSGNAEPAGSLSDEAFHSDPFRRACRSDRARTAAYAWRVELRRIQAGAAAAGLRQGQGRSDRHRRDRRQFGRDQEGGRQMGGAQPRRLPGQ